ncbi:MAG TPA: amino acid adenylation domain-containing protein [Pseudomonadota bacterium]|nr:amino acid adenylation domain-containing protein [Pseudomonadota bacterium]
MTAKELLSYLLRHGIELWVEGDRLRYRGLKRTLPPQLMALLRQHKVELQELLRELKSSATVSFPLSQTQKAFWFLHQLNPTSSAYNGCLAITLRGAVSTPALHRAFEQLCMRHPSLRTSLVLRDGLPWQKVDAKPSCVLSVVDATQWTEGALHERLQAEAHRPFDLLREAAHRLYLYQRSAQESVLLFCLHHIHMDGWSLGILIRDFGALYRSQLSGQPAQLPALPAAYSDFVAWQQHLLLSPEGESHTTYWLDDLVGVPQVLELPTDWPRPNTRSDRGARLSWVIDASLSQRVKALAAQEGTTLNVLLFSVFALLLHRYSGQEEFLIGSPYHGRSERRWENVLGCFINSLALRVRFPTGLTFRALLQEVSERSHAALAHADYPFPLLVERLRPQRELSRTPLFQVMFGYENFQGADLLLSTLAGTAQAPELDSVFGVPLTPWKLSQQEGQVDLSMTATEANGVLCYSLSYMTDLFAQPTIEQMAAHFEQLLRSVTEEPHKSIASLPLLSAMERHLLLSEYNATASPFPSDRCVHQLFEAQVQRTPDACAVVFAGRQLSYRQLNCRANILAHHLRSLGVGPEVLVGLCVQRSPEMLIGLLAILKSGGAYVPLDPTYPPARLSLMLQDAAPSAVLVQRSLLSRLPQVSAPWVFIDDFAEAPAAHRDNPPSLSAPSHLAYVIYTSGSTGRPKGVMIEHRGLTNYLHWASHAYPVASGQGVPVHSSIAFDLTVTSLFIPLLSGGFVVLVPEEDAVTALASLLGTRRNFGLVKLTPAHLDVLAQLLAAEDLSASTGALVIGGEALLYDSLAFWKKHAPATRLLNEYGPTETVVGCCLYEVQELGPSATVPIGKPIANTEIFVLDPHLQLLPRGAVGELYIGGVGVARGYLNRPELTAEKFIRNPFSSDPTSRLYKSGDLARFRSDGNLEFLGRIDHQVKLRGFRIELGEIESVLSAQPEVRDCVVLAREDTPGDKRLIAYVVPQPDQQPSSTLLSEHLANKLPAYMLPAAFVFLEALPLSPNGKLDRAALPAPSYERSTDDFARPRTPVEQALADIFAQILHLERVGIHENFFSLGGHSLLATQAASRVRETLGVELAVAALFAAPTVAGLSAAIAIRGGTTPTQDMPPVAQLPRDAPLALSFAQQRLWFLEQLDPGLPLYNIPAALRLRGPLDRECLRLALQGIVSRHEALRTTFSSAEPEPFQVIHPAPSGWPLPLLDLSALPPSAREAERSRLAEQEARRPFSLEHGPLLRTTLVCLSEQEHVLLFTLHHIISDGWSLGVLFRELSALYTALRERRPADLPALRAQVADIGAWQRQLLQGERLQQALAYWKRQLAGCPPVELPTDHPRPPVPSYRGRILTFSLDPSLGRALKTLAQSQQATLFMTLLGSFALLLSRYSQQTDIAIGSPTAGRICTEMEPLIGCFVNTLVLRTSLDDRLKFRELLARVRQSCLDAYSHQQLPFERLVDELHVTRDRSRNPLFQVMFLLQNAPLDELRLPDLESSYVLVHQQTSKFDLTLSVEEQPDGGLSGAFEYATDLFEPTTIERMAGHYARLLREIVEHPDLPIAELQPVTDGERLHVVPQPRPQPGQSVLHEPLPAKLPDHTLPARSYARSPEPLAAPRTPLEQTLVELFAQLLHHDRIGIHDSFFALGGHSLLAVRLSAQLARRTGRALPLSTLFQHPTVAGLAAVLEDRAAALPHQTVLALQPGGSRPPLFCVHPVGGNVLCYGELARALGTGQPVYGVQATPVAAGDEEPPETLEAVASRYVTALRQVQPAGPYQLLGWSLGGVLAFEMARQLHEAGQRVALLALLDSAAPAPQQRAELHAALSEPALLQWFLTDLTRQRNDATAALPDERPTDLRAALPLLSSQGLLPSNKEEAQLAALYALFRRNLRLAIDYRPGPYEGPVLLLRAAASPAAPDLGWQSLCSCALELVELPGDHYTTLSPANVGTVARLLCARLLGSEPNDPT